MTNRRGFIAALLALPFAKPLYAQLPVVVADKLRRYDAYRFGIEHGWLSLDDVRELEEGRCE